MNRSGDASHHSVDQLIHSLQTWRRQDHQSPLADLLAGKPISSEVLIDLACIDLMLLRRAGGDVCVEDYTNQFPQLQQQRFLLDLIDAEICVAIELKQPVDTHKYAARFPDCIESIAELIAISDRRGVSIDPHSDESSVPDDSVDFSFDGSSKSLPLRSLPDEAVVPLETPSWFIAESCVASAPGRWLIRGRDTNTGRFAALKVLELPIEVTANQTSQLMDVCQAGSGVSHASWARPVVAATQQRRLGVIRPWVFGMPWEFGRAEVSIELQRLATVAFALAASHRCGAAHGGVHAQNLLIDHDDQIHLVDAVSNRGIDRWLRGESGNVLSLSQRQQIDANDLIMLVSAATVHGDARQATKLVKQLRRINGSQSCAEIGDTLMRWSQRVA